MLNINRAVGRRIAYYRKQKGIYQYKLAELVGIRARHLGDIEGGRKTARIPTLARIAWALGVTLSELLGDGEMRIE